MWQDIKECREATGEDPQWTGAMFSGMPAYLDQRGVSGTDRKAHRRPRHKAAERAYEHDILRHAADVDRAAGRRHRPVDRHRRLAGIRPFDILLPDNRRGTYNQDVGAGIRAARDLGRVVYAQAQHVGRRRTDGTGAVARTGSQPPADNILLRAGRGGAVGSARCGSPASSAHGAASHREQGAGRSRPARRRIQLLAAVVYDDPSEIHHARRLGGGSRQQRAPQPVAGLRYGMELRQGREPQHAHTRTQRRLVDRGARRRGRGAPHALRNGRRQRHDGRSAGLGILRRLLGRPAYNGGSDISRRGGDTARARRRPA